MGSDIRLFNSLHASKQTCPTARSGMMDSAGGGRGALFAGGHRQLWQRRLGMSLPRFGCGLHWYHFGVDAPPILEPCFFFVGWDVTGGCDLAFDPWPFGPLGAVRNWVGGFPLPLG